MKNQNQRSISARIMNLLSADSVPLSDAWKTLIDDAEHVELQERRKPQKTIVTSYSHGIAAAANWVDQQRESYDNEHGRRDNDTGSFEFGNDAQRDYSDTLAEIAEGIRALHPSTRDSEPVAWRYRPVDDVPGNGGGGWKGFWKLSLEPVEAKVGLMRTEVQPLYAAPQPAPAPAPAPAPVVNDIRIKKAIAWLNRVIYGNPRMKEPVTCRAALLQLSGNTEQLNQAPVKQPASKCPKCGDLGTYYDSQMRGSVFCDCVLKLVSTPYKLPPNSFTDDDLAMMAHGDNPQSNAYRELLAFRRNSPVTPDGSACKYCGGTGYFRWQQSENMYPCPCKGCTELAAPHLGGKDD
ncbi:hypothetical protein S483_001278 [Salmonella enterica subsp. salamae]|nr:hypothetical protein [Salmonella enterica subsp. salamae]